MALSKAILHKQLHAQRFVAVSFLALIIISVWGFKKSPVAQKMNRGHRIPVLLFGIDAADASQHTDTLMMGVLDPVVNLFNVLSIPRDTRVRIPGYRFHRINEIFGYHVRKTKDPWKSADKVLEGVEHVLSTKDEPVDIPYFVQVDYSGFRKMVDLLNGVWIDVKTPMHYDDNAGNYHFHKEPGRYLMSGEEALHFVRYRGATGDRGRILRQQEFLRNTAKRFVNPLNVLKLPQMVLAVTSSIRTNLSIWDIFYLSVAARKLRPGRLGFYILPGRPSGPFWKVKKKSANHLAASLILGKTLEDEGLAPIVPQSTKITVKVWNASENKGMAYRVTKYLRSQGYDVVDWGNYPVVQAATRVIDRTGKIVQAQDVSKTLGIKTFHSEPNPRALADVELILGRNYNGIGTIP